MIVPKWLYKLIAQQNNQILKKRFNLNFSVDWRKFWIYT